MHKMMKQRREKDSCAAFFRQNLQIAGRLFEGEERRTFLRFLFIRYCLAMTGGL